MEERRLLSFDEVGQVLDEAAEALPEALFEGLNGGVVLREDTVPSPHGAGLYTLGTYHHQPTGLGRYIVINYGSFARVHRHSTVAEQKAALDRVLRHELTHHIESLAGVRDLEVKDEIFLEKYGKKDK